MRLRVEVEVEGGDGKMWTRRNGIPLLNYSLLNYISKQCDE